MSQNRSVGIVAGLVAAVAFATSGPVVKPLLVAGWSPGSAILVRLSVAALLLAGPAAWAVRGRWHVVRDEWRSRRPLEVTALQQLWDRRAAQRGFARNALVFLRRKAHVRAGAAVWRRTKI